MGSRAHTPARLLGLHSTCLIPRRSCGYNVREQNVHRSGEYLFSQHERRRPERAAATEIPVASGNWGAVACESVSPLNVPSRGCLPDPPPRPQRLCDRPGGNDDAPCLSQLALDPPCATRRRRAAEVEGSGPGPTSDPLPSREESRRVDLAARASVLRALPKTEGIP